MASLLHRGGRRQEPSPGDSSWFGIRVVDEATGRGVPLIELETVHRVQYFTDSAGWAAVCEPGLMGQEVFFHVRGHGYEVPKDGFGFRGVRLRLAPGGRAEVRVKRTNIAERLCRLTGEGIYRDSVLLGQPTPLKEPTLSGLVLGQDSAHAVPYKGRMFWLWGDTNQAAYPLGNFRTTCAWASYPKGRTTAEMGLDYQYFTRPGGFAREMVPSDKPGPIWLDGLVVLPDESGQERLLAHFSRMKDLGTILEQGYVRWDDAREVFTLIREVPVAEKWRFLQGHPIRFMDGGVEYLAGGFSLPLVRVRAAWKSVLDPAAYEIFTCLAPGGPTNPKDAGRARILRDGARRAAYTWRKEGTPINSEMEHALVKAGKLKPNETRYLPRDAAGQDIILHGGSVTWNPWRKKWIFIATRNFGKASLLGEIYYGEADHPTGPWRKTVQIMTHDRYTFYNPVHHPFLDTDGGRIIYLEGTYTESFSGNERPTPRYDYNQMLYRLDLSDPRLNAAR
jgi:hypothetical protein